MRDMTRRKAIGTAAAALVAGSVTRAARGQGPGQDFRTTGSASMTLEEFQDLNGSGSVARLFGHMDCKTLAMCHESMKKEHGIWIPELVPVFEELDAMAAGERPEAG